MKAAQFAEKGMLRKIKKESHHDELTGTQSNEMRAPPRLRNAMSTIMLRFIFSPVGFNVS